MPPGHCWHGCIFEKKLSGILSQQRFRKKYESKLMVSLMELSNFTDSTINYDSP